MCVYYAFIECLYLAERIFWMETHGADDDDDDDDDGGIIQRPQRIELSKSAVHQMHFQCHFHENLPSRENIFLCVCVCVFMHLSPCHSIMASSYTMG
jgi:hypothetical protein